jgi:hypothetical protein
MHNNSSLEETLLLKTFLSIYFESLAAPSHEIKPKMIYIKLKICPLNKKEPTSCGNVRSKDLNIRLKTYSTKTLKPYLKYLF